MCLGCGFAVKPKAHAAYDTSAVESKVENKRGDVECVH